jgi:fumarylacetoacetase
VTAARVDRSHDAGRRSWVESADRHPEFPIQNLPVGVFHLSDDEDVPRVGMAIGDSILDLVAAHDAGYFGGLAERAAEACAAPALNQLMALGQPYWSALREQAADLLDAGSAAYRGNPRLGDRLLVPQDEAELLLPAQVGDYTDFYASVHHATNVGSMFRPDNPLLPNYKWVPIGYHGRASSLVPSGTPVRRPQGQTKAGDAPPVFGPSRSP